MLGGAGRPGAARSVAVLSRSRCGEAGLRLIVLGTDGKQSVEGQPAYEADVGRGSGAVVAVVGTGPAVDQAELSAIAGPHQLVFTSADFAAAADSVPSMAHRLCLATNRPL